MRFVRVTRQKVAWMHGSGLQVAALLPFPHEDFVVSAGPDIDAKERVRQATDIVDVIGGYTELRRQGANFVCRCPWHDDRKPSLTVNQQRQSWKCWVCNIGGDVFSFVMKKENVDFREALELLAQKANIELHSTPMAKVAPGSPQDKKTLYAAMAWMERTFHECLLRADVAASARNYLEDRGLSAESIERFNIGFSPNEWSWLIERARHSQYSPEILDACGMLSHGTNSGKTFDRFRGRVLFPIHDPQGRTVAFGGRVLPEFAETLPGKYINSPETRLFSKSDHLYALDAARETIAKTKNITVVEGYTDVIMAHQFGATDVVAVLGTALGARHIQNLRRYSERITLVLDGDAAGQRRTNEILELFVQAQVDLRILTLPEEYDPCEFFLEKGLDAWNALLATAVDALEHKVRTATADIDLARDVHRATKALEEVLATIAQAPADVLSGPESGNLRLQQILRRLARDFRVPEESVRERLKELRRRTQERAGASSTIKREPPSSSVPDPYVVVSAKALSPDERALLEIMAAHPDLALTALQEVSVEDFSNAPARDIFETHRRLEEAGHELSFAAVLSELTDERLQSLWVEIDENASLKAGKAMQDAATLLRTIIDRIHSHELERVHRERIAVLEEEKLGEEEAKLVFLQILEQQRRRTGISTN